MPLAAGMLAEFVLGGVVGGVVDCGSTGTEWPQPLPCSRGGPPQQDVDG